MTRAERAKLKVFMDAIDEFLETAPVTPALNMIRDKVLRARVQLIDHTLPHKDSKALAKRTWPRAAWISGAGRYASVAVCRDLTVILFQELADARAAKALIDQTACGGACCRNHYLYDLELNQRIKDAA